MLRKDVYLYEYTDNWEGFDETSLPDEKAFYSELNLEDVTGEDYKHYKKVWEIFEIKSLGEYHDLYAQCDILLLEMYLETLETSVLKYMDLILLIFVYTGSSMASLLKNDRSRIRIINRLICY